jgi:hypothetical protein
MSKRFIGLLETVSTLVFLGSVSIGCGAISIVLLYNMALVLLQEAGQMPLLSGCVIIAGALFIGYLCNAPSYAYHSIANAYDEDPIHYEEDPAPIPTI